ncbi:MAG: DUF1266 domain-containing protein [Sedimentisphaerales bacterium]|nr:DUF1266 domain-containing protein [Sedimentisphaerales bacterium]
MIHRQYHIGLVLALLLSMMLYTVGWNTKSVREENQEIILQQLSVESKEDKEKHPEGESSSQEKGSQLPSRKAWALGCAALLFEVNHERHDIMGNIPSDWGIKEWKHRLSESWGIESREDLLSSIKILEEHGHRESFNRMGLLVSSLSQGEYEKFVQRITSEENQNELRIVRQYYQELGDKSILGWDYSRIICLCRWGYHVGYITEDEAWEKILSTARILQNTFDSWEDLGRNYLIGRQFWSYENTKDDGYKFEDAYQRLLDMPTSPWKRYSWVMNLDDPNALKEAPKKKKRDVHTF